MPAGFSQERFDDALTTVHVPFTRDSVDITLQREIFLNLEVPRDAEGKQLSAKQMYAECMESLRPFGVSAKWIEKSNLLLCALLSGGGDKCTVEQTKANFIWMCAFCAMDDFFDGKRSVGTESLVATAEAIRPKYDVEPLPADVEALITPEGKVVIETMKGIRIKLMRPLFKSRLQQFENAFDEFIVGVLHELNGLDDTNLESEFIAVRLKTIGVRQFMEVNWEFHHASDEDIAAIEQVVHYALILIALDNDLISHQKTLRERGDEPVRDYVTLHGTMDQARIGRDEYFAKFLYHVQQCSENNTALRGSCNLVAANVLFSVISRRYLETPVDIRRFFNARTAAWLSQEAIIPSA